ncbi:hypothetical protein B0H67DRAFT_341486 [Lasiosphaeris hirsuta]|uniref:C3H1-type domain-containing protein n=1 Tax=Lasiosphaeris hirsuta TaxID=260670 RepID=A0AA40DPK4_9PEZI|nr:hypothetical protein B0H67DRAFT_341486 [Lasiosphaeris hirsuta]
MSYQPMPFRSDVTSVLSLAQTVADDFSRAPAVFSSGEHAAIELISELRSYQQFHSTHNRNNNNDPNSQANFESSLTANLRPCRDALKTMFDTRQKYGRDAKLGMKDNLRWVLGAGQFEQQVTRLRQDTARLRELVHELQRSAVVSSTSQQQQPHRGNGSGAPALLQTQTTVSIGGIQYASYPPQHTQRTSTTNFTSTSQDQNRTLTEICPNGSGCRTPRCHLDYLHPKAPGCESGKNCGVRDCDKWHPKSALCPKGPSCPMVECDKAHPWPRESPVPPASHPRDEGSFSSSTNTIADFSRTMGSQPPQPSEWDVGGAPSRQTLWRGRGTTPTAGPATLGVGPIVVMIQTTLGNGNPRNPNNNDTGNQGWCKLRFQCPGGYNGACPLKHPRRAACRDFAEHGYCSKGASCTYDHGVEAAATTAQDKAQGGSQYIAELPARR